MKIMIECRLDVQATSTLRQRTIMAKLLATGDGGALCLRVSALISDFTYSDGSRKPAALQSKASAKHN